MKKLLLLLVASMALSQAAMSQPASVLQEGNRPVTKRQLPAQRNRQRPSALQMTRTHRLQAQHSQLREGVINPIHPLLTTAPQRISSAMPQAQGDATQRIWAIVISSNNEADGGCYEFTATSSPQFEAHYTSPSMAYCCGTSIITGDSIFHCVKDYFGSGMSYLEYNAFTGDMLDVENTSPDYDFLATDMAIDPQTGDIYGAFFNADQSAMELGIAHYATLTRTTIGQLSTPVQVLAAASNGQLYGIGIDGNLYKISRHTAAMTLVGPTGITLSQDGTNSYNQTGEIAPASNIFYWACYDAQAHSALYTVNLATGQASKICDMPNGEQMVGMSFPVTTAAGVPRPVSLLTADFHEAQTTGTVHFTMPTLNTNDETLYESLTYTVKSNGQEIATGQAQPGEAVAVTATLEKGSNNISVTTTSKKGSSEAATCKCWVGYDEPKPVRKLFATILRKHVTVGWTAPTQGVHGGYIGTLTYDVVRTPGNKTVARGLNTTTFEENLDENDSQSYCYTVIARNNEQQSQELTSNQLTAADVATPPYAQDFDLESDMQQLTIVDANEDGATWKWATPGVATTSYPAVAGGSDDYLITPYLHLKADNVYALSFDLYGDGEAWPERFEVLMGETASPYDFHETVVPSQYCSSTDVKQFLVYITNAEDRDVRFAFHHNSPQSDFTGHLYLDNIKVEQGASMQAPDSVTHLTIIPDEDGALGATATFSAPTTDVSGKPITELTEIRVYRDNKQVGTVARPTPGKSYSIYDGNPTHGLNTWRAVATNAQGDGLYAETSHFIGPDLPQNVTGTRLIDNGEHWSATWNASPEEGRNGGFSDPEHTWYTISNVLESPLGGYAESNPIVNHIEGTQADIIDNYDEDGIDYVFHPSEGEQDFQYFAIKATNPQGSSAAQMVQCIKGKPYDMPFRESFPAGELTYGMAWIAYDIKSDNKLYISSENSADLDGGCAEWYSPGGGETFYLNLGKVALSGSENPTLMYQYYASPGLTASLGVVAVTADGQEVELGTTEFSRLSGNAGWREQTISLDPLRAQRWVYLRFVMRNPGDACHFMLDNINLIDTHTHDLSLSMETPQSANAGDVVTAQLRLRNVGTQPVAAGTYSVKLYVGDRLVNEMPGELTLNPLDELPLNCNYTTSINAPTELRVKAVVEYSADEATTDNVAESQIAISQPEGITIDDLAATTDGTHVSLSWTAPEKQQAEQVTEDFERYAPWLIGNIGRWTLIDGDGGLTGTFSNMPAFPHVNEPFAYIVMNPEQWGIDPVANPFMAAHSGSQYLTAFYTYKSSSEGDYYVPADNWLISPRLSGEAQTVSCYVRCLKNDGESYDERYSVEYSTGGTTPQEFSKIDGNRTTSSGDWELVTAELPEGTTHFALHHNSIAGQGFLFSIDDVTYTQAESAPIVGYNLYRDGQKIATLGTDETAYIDTPADNQTHTYNVTVLYADGESRYSNDALICTGIDTITGDGKKYDIYTPGGVRVRTQATTLDGLPQGVYIINGRKVVK